MPESQHPLFRRVLPLLAAVAGSAVLLSGCTAAQIKQVSEGMKEAGDELATSMPTTVAKGAGHGSAHLVISEQAIPGLHRKDHYWTSAWCLQSDGAITQWSVPDDTRNPNAEESLIGQRTDGGWRIIYSPDDSSTYFGGPTDRQAKDTGPIFTKKGERVTITFDGLELEAVGGAQLYLSGTVKCGEILAW